MLERVKLALRISTTVYNSELLDLIAAAIADLRQAGPVFTAEAVGTEGTVTDYTISDPLVRTAVVTYVRMRFGSPADYDGLKAAYDEQKAQMRETTAYGMVEA